MAVDLHMLKTMEGGDDNRTEAELTKPTAQGSDDRAEAAEPVYKKGAWSKEEDEKLTRAVEEYGVRNWVTIEKCSGLARPAKNCRLRWLNYLRPNLKKYPFTEEEERLILHLHSKYGNSWSRIASKLPGRSDNEIKNFWHKRAKKCQKQHLPIYPTTTTERKQSHTKDETNADDKYFQSYSDHILPSTSIQTTKTPTDASSMIHSPQTLVSTSQQPELTRNTTPLPNTPTCQNLHLSPNQRSQSSSGAFFTPLVEPPLLSSPQGRFKRFSTPQNESAFLPQHSYLQMQRLSNMESPTSPLKLKLSPRVPQLTTGCPGALLPPLSPLKLCLSSIPVRSESNLSIPNSSNVRLNSSTPAVQFSSPVQPMEVDTDNAIPQYFSLETKPTSIQLGLPEIGEINRSMHDVESDCSLKIMDELREAQARVKFLKKMLRQKGISNKTNLQKQSTRKLDFLGESSSEMTRKESLSSTSSRTKDSKNILNIGGDIFIEPRLSKLQDIEKSTSEKYVENNIDWKKVTTQDEASMGNTNSLQKAEDLHSLGEIFEIKNLQEQRRSINLFDPPSSENTINALNSTSWDNRFCDFRVPAAGKCFSGWSTLDGSFIESSTPLQDSFLKGDAFDLRSGIKQPLADGSGIVYSQSTTTSVIIRPGDESGRLTYLQRDGGGYYDDNFGQEDAPFMDSNLVTLTSCEANLLLHQYPAIDLQESSYLASQPMMEHESGINLVESSKLCESSLLQHQCPTTNLLDSSYLVSKQIVEQESMQGEQFSFQTSGGGSSAETSKLCESTLLLHHNPSVNVIDSMYRGALNDNCPTDFISRETWKQEPSQEENLMEGLLIENLWPEGQMVSQDQTLFPNRPTRMTYLVESKNWNNETDYGHAEVPNRKEDQEHGHDHDHMNTMPEELSNLLEFFPTSIQPLEWYNNSNEIPDEFDKGIGLHVTSTSQPLITIADYM